MIGAQVTEEKPTQRALRRTGEIRQHDTHLSVWEDGVDEKAMRRVLRGMLARLAARGWRIERDPTVLKNYPVIADRYWVGRKGDLQMCADTMGRTCKIEFFQDVLRPKDPNSNGGRYDFDKFKGMPRHLRLMFCVEVAAVIHKLLSYGYHVQESFVDRIGSRSLPHAVLLTAQGMDPAADPLAYFNARWKMGQGERFERDASGWPTEKEYGASYNTDRDKLPIRNGEVRYFRGHDGYLRRGTVFTNMNTGWSVVHGGTVSYVTCSDLFHCARPDLEPRRLVRGQPARLLRELERATATRNGARVAALAKVLDRVGWPVAEKR